VSSTRDISSHTITTSIGRTDFKGASLDLLDIKSHDKGSNQTQVERRAFNEFTQVFSDCTAGNTSVTHPLHIISLLVPLSIKLHSQSSTSLSDLQPLFLSFNERSCSTHCTDNFNPSRSIPDETTKASRQLRWWWIFCNNIYRNHSAELTDLL